MATANINTFLNKLDPEVVISFVDRYLKMKERQILFDRYEWVVLTFEEAKDVAYTYIFQQEIYTHIASDYRLNKDELKTIQEMFIHKVSDICGPHIMNDLEDIRGGIEPVILELSHYFVNRVNKEESQLLNTDEENEINKDKSKINNISISEDHNRYKF